MNATRAHRFRFWHVDLAGSVAFVLLSVAAYMAGLHPLFVARARATAELADMKRTATELHAQHRQINQRLTRFREAMPETPIVLQPVSRLNQRLDGLIQLARQSGLAIDEIRPGSTVQGAHFQQTTIHLIASGSYRQCVGFLNQSHERFRDVSVTRFALEANPSDANPVATCTIKLVWYTAPKDGEAPGRR